MLLQVLKKKVYQSHRRMHNNNNSSGEYVIGRAIEEQLVVYGSRLCAVESIVCLSEGVTIIMC